MAENSRTEDSTQGVDKQLEASAKFVASTGPSLATGNSDTTKGFLAVTGSRDVTSMDDVPATTDVMLDKHVTEMMSGVGFGLSDDDNDSPEPLPEDLLRFCSRNVSFLKHWPVDILSRHPRQCMFHYFNRGQVLVRDSNNSDWIYIVKSGSLSVLKKLNQTTPKQNKKQKRGSRTLPPLKPSRQTPLLATPSPFPKVYNNQFELENRLEEALPGYRNPKERLGVIDYDRVIAEHKARLKTRATQVPVLPPIGGLARGPSTLQEEELQSQAGMTDLLDEDDDLEGVDSLVDTDSEYRSLVSQRSIRRTGKGVYLSSSHMGRKRRRGDHLPPKGSFLPAASPPPLSQPQDVREVLAKLQLEHQRRVREREGRKTIAEELDYKGTRDFVYTETDLHPAFVLITVLERGQYFGVSSMVFPDQTSLCLVSNGAECIVLSKKLFREHASDSCMRHIWETENPYPGDVELQQQLQNYTDWQAGRSKLYRSLVADVETRRARRRQFTHQILGTYCFRSGPLW